MGWWNAGVYGGDETLQWQEKIYGMVGVEIYGSDHAVQAIPNNILSEKIGEIVESIESGSANEDNKNIGYQILGAIIMHSGFDIDSEDNLRQRIIKESDEDAYSKENFLRKNVMKNFKKLIKEFNPSEPVNILDVNVFEEPEDDDEQIAKEFKEVFGLMKARIKKLESGIEEKSGNKEYDEGYEAASQEEIDFLTDFMELMSKMEMMGVLFEKINQGLVGSPISSGSSEMGAKMESGTHGNASFAPSPTKSTPSGSGKDIMPG
jgi:hypothetical protein